MKVTSLSARITAAQAAFLLVAALSFTAIAYQAGLSGSFHFDDPPNLGGLARVTDMPSAIRFIASGEAGPLGRPLTLASFAPQAYAWPSAPEVFLWINSCIHALNGVLVVWLVYLLTVAQSRVAERAAWISVMTGTLWMLLPILASSSLLVVQRMTTLSAAFLLLGLIGYLYGRRLIDSRPPLALLLMTASLALGTTLAALAKENGALLPLFVLVIESTLLPKPCGARAWYWRAWCGIFLVAPTAALAGYLATRIPYSESVQVFRGYLASERLLTEARILWEYLYNAFLPATSNLGPFHDDYPIQRSWLDPLSLLALLAWLCVLAGALTLKRRAPLFSFAVGWYVIGHALESTTIPLELYFEHRNYLPLVGPVFALVATLAALPKWQPIVRAGLLAYGLLLGVVLFNTTSLWGKPALAAEIWAIEHPGSRRANQFLVQQLERSGNHLAARRVLRHYDATNPGSAAVELQILALSCVLEPKERHAGLLQKIRTSLASSGFEHGVFEAIRDLYRLAEDGRCAAVNRGIAYELAQIAATNKAFKASPPTYHNLHVLMSEETFAQRRLDLTMHHIEAALSARYTLSTLELAVQVLSSAGLYAVAEDFLHDAHKHEPLNPLRATIWRRQIAVLQKALEIERQ